MKEQLTRSLEAFRSEHKVKGKGPLCVMLHITRYAQTHSLPLDSDDLVTGQGGQVLGLGVASVQAVLADYGIERTLAKEGGRTSRGSLGLMKKYVSALNRWHEAEIAALKEIEQWWIDRVKDYLTSQPLRLRYDQAKSLSALIEGLLGEARKRDEEGVGARDLGTVLQHLVGAKLQIALSKAEVTHHSASAADASTGRAGDFLIRDSAIHVTSYPQRRLAEVCQANLDAGLAPVVVTLQERIPAMEYLVQEIGAVDRVEIYEVTQFLALNINEWAGFGRSKRRSSVEQLVDAYNTIIEQVETDPSLKIKLG